MIQVRVGSIERHPVTGAPLVSLEPCDGQAHSRLVLPLSTAVACSLSHELEGQTTLRGMVYSLLREVADVLGGQVAAVEIVPAPNDMAAGRVRIDGADGTTHLPIEIALGIGMAVVLRLPLQVAPELVRSAPRLDRTAGQPTGQPAGALPPGDVPDAFRRAFTS